MNSNKMWCFPRSANDKRTGFITLLVVIHDCYQKASMVLPDDVEVFQHYYPVDSSKHNSIMESACQPKVCESVLPEYNRSSEFEVRIVHVDQSVVGVINVLHHDPLSSIKIAKAEVAK